jgi:hypothetical protein
MSQSAYWSTKRIAAVFMLMSLAVSLVGFWSFDLRGGVGSGVGPTYERVAFVLSVIFTVAAVKLLEAPLVLANAANLAKLASTAYLIAGPVLLVGEGLALGSGGRATTFIIAFYVFLALFAQAVLGAALLKSRLVPAPVGWLTLVWNVGIAIILPIITRGDMYYPIIHVLMPTVIAISILMSK